MSASASRGDNTDRSLARSAWESAAPKEPSRRVRYDRAQLIPEVFLVEMCAVFLKGRLNTLLERFVSDDVRAAARCIGPFPEPARFSFRIRNFITPIIVSVRTPARITPYPTGRLLGWRCPRHFVPGYDRTVPPGHFATGFS